MTHTSRLLAFAAVLALALPPLPALAQPAAQPSKQARDEAGTRFRKGVELFKDGDFQAALIEFRRAYDLAPNFNVLYNIGQVYFQLQDYPGALRTLQRYLDEGGNQVPNARRAEVEKDIAKLMSRVANLEVTSNVADAEVAVDDVSVGKTPIKALMVSAGRHKITVSKAGFTAVTKVVEMASGDSVKVALELIDEHVAQPAPVPAPVPALVAPVQPPPPIQPPLSPEPPPEKSVPWAGWAVTGGLAVGAGIFGGLALSASSDLKNQRTSPGATRDSLNSAHDKTAAFALVSDILSGSAVLAGGISLYLTVSGPSDKGPRPSAPGPTAALLRIQALPGGVQASGSF